MADLTQDIQARRKTFDFNDILSLFGKFTPSFKMTLSHFQKSQPNQFMTFASDVFQAFRNYLMQLSQIPAGPERAILAHRLIDEEIRKADLKDVTCRKGCMACCQLEKHVTSDEADLLAELVNSGAVKIDQTRLKTADPLRPGCVFLDDSGNCKVYAHRPAVCRKHFVTSPVENCETVGGDIEPVQEFMPEIIVSAAMSLPDNGIGALSQELKKRLHPSDMSDTDAKGLVKSFESPRPYQMRPR